MDRTARVPAQDSVFPLRQFAPVPISGRILAQHPTTSSKRAQRVQEALLLRTRRCRPDSAGAAVLHRARPAHRWRPPSPRATAILLRATPRGFPLRCFLSATWFPSPAPRWCASSALPRAPRARQRLPAGPRDHHLVRGHCQPRRCFSKPPQV